MTDNANKRYRNFLNSRLLEAGIKGNPGKEKKGENDIGLWAKPLPQVDLGTRWVFKFPPNQSMTEEKCIWNSVV